VSEPKADFEQCVFINCPFDDDYMPMLRVLIFTVIRCGFLPRIATEHSDSGEVRIKKIVNIIGESKFSVHDISRIESLKAGDLPRFNMPFELGIDIGCRELGESLFKTKRCLVLEKEKFTYQKVLSDISGNDIKAHDGDPFQLVKAVRDWFADNGVFGLSSPYKIWDAYNVFLLKLTEEAEGMGYPKGDYSGITIAEYIYSITRFIATYKGAAGP
jgi:hypothetical protein